MAVTTKILFPATSNSSTTDFSLSGLQLNNQDDLDVYVTKTTAGIAANNNKRILHFRQSSSSNVDANHNQVNNTDGLYFPAITHTGGTETLENYQIVNNNGTVRFNSALPQGAIVFVERRTRDADGTYTSFASGSTIRAADLNSSSTESNFTAQEARNKALTIEGVLFDGDQPNTNFVTSSHIVDGSIVNADINASADISGSKIANDSLTLDKLGSGPLPTDITVASANIVNGTIIEEDVANSAVTSNKIADNAVTTTEILNGAVTTAKLAADAVDGTKLADEAVDSEHYTDGSIDRVHLSADIIDSTKLDDNAVDSEHYVDGSIQTVHIADGQITEPKLAVNSVNTGKIVDGTISTNKIADNAITTAKIADAAIVTNAEQAASTPDDVTFFTTAAAEARYFNVSSGETIKDGDTFPDNDTTIATTAAINDRIIDIVNDVGGFDIVDSEQHFPDTNPQGQAGSAAVLSIKAASANLVPSGTTLTITNGNLADNADITITGVTSTIPQGFGFIVESTSTLHTYTFHRLVPKATEVTTVAGKATEIGRLGTAAAVEDMSILGTTDVVADMAILGTTDVVADMNLLAVSDVISDMNTLAVTDVINDMDTVATNVANVNNVGTNIAKVNTVAAAIGGTQTFVVTVSGGVFYIDGQSNPVLTLARGFTYTFNVSDSSNSGHPLRFKDGSGNSYTTGVTTSGTAGSSGATVVIAVAANAPSSLRYYCTVHGNGMGNTITVTDDNIGIVAGSITNVNEVGDDITNVNSVAGSITNVNTVASNINSVNSFFNQYRIGANNPTTSLDVGDLFFNTTSNSLKVYTGSAWVDGVTATGNFAVVTGNTFTGSNVYNDNAKAIFGTSSDGLEIFNNGNHSRLVDNGTGNIEIASDSGINFFNGDFSETLATFTPNGAITLYHDNVKRIETTASGTTVTGGNLVLESSFPTFTLKDVDHNPDWTLYNGNGTFRINQSTANINCMSVTSTDASFDVDVRIPFDDHKLQLGADNDLEILHDGNHSRIRDVGTGALLLETDGSSIQLNKGTSENMLVATPDGSVDLYHNGIKKLETTSSGVTVTGTTTTGNLTLNSSFPTISLTDSDHNNDYSIINGNGTFRITDTTIGLSRFAIAGDGTASFAKNVDCAEGLDVTGNITVTGTVDGVDIASFKNSFDNLSTDIVNDTSPQLGGNLDTNSFEIDLDDGHAVRFGASQDLQIYHNTHNYIVTGNGNIELRSTVGSDEAMIKCKPDDAVELYYNGGLKLATTSSGVSTDGLMNFNGTGDKILIGDNGKIAFGGGLDLTIHSDGTNALINVPAASGYLQVKNDGGDLYLDAKQGTSTVLIRSGNGTNGLNNAVICNGNGDVDLYYQNSLKASTTSNGLQVNSTLHINGGGISRSGHNVGHLVGSYNNIGANADKTNPIYTIGSNYNPNESALSNMYGVGFSHGNASFTPSGAGWGMYVASDGVSRIFLDGSNGRIYFPSERYISDISGSYGSYGTIQVNGGGAGAWEGYSIDGRVVFMHDGNSAMGLYNDVENEWFIYGERNGGLWFYHNGSDKLLTTSYGIRVNGTIHINDTNTAITEGGTNSIRLATNSGYVDIGPQNTGYCHIQTDRPTFYFNKEISIDGHCKPYGSNKNLGSSSARWANIYTNDLHLSNEGSSNDVDQTWGDWTIQEGESDLFLKNNRSGKKYKFNLTEVS